MQGRPGFPERDIRVVAQASPARELSEELLGEHHAGGECQERHVRRRPSEALRDPLPGPQALALLQGLRLQLGRRRSEGLRQRRRTSTVVEGPRLHGRAAAEALSVEPEEKDGAELGEAQGGEARVAGHALEDECDRSQKTRLAFD